MGPSPTGDGEVKVVWKFSQVSPMLQWGRRQQATESRGFDEGVAHCRQASMGPSPTGDGEAGSGGGVPGEMRASMGPSPTGDGEQEKVVNWDGKYHASMGPSPTGDGELDISPDLAAMMAKASMGPSPTGDGEFALVVLLGGDELLQWGRRQQATESREQMLGAPRCPLRFNGAVANRRRRG